MTISSIGGFNGFNNTNNHRQGEKMLDGMVAKQMGIAPYPGLARSQGITGPGDLNNNSTDDSSESSSYFNQGDKQGEKMLDGMVAQQLGIPPRPGLARSMGISSPSDLNNDSSSDTFSNAASFNQGDKQGEKMLDGMVAQQLGIPPRPGLARSMGISSPSDLSNLNSSNSCDSNSDFGKMFEKMMDGFAGFLTKTQPYPGLAKNLLGLS